MFRSQSNNKDSYERSNLKFKFKQLSPKAVKTIKQLTIMSHLIQQTTENRRQRIKKFQNRMVNRSCADLFFYQKLADSMLECCSPEAKPNTISIFSLIPLLVANCVISPGEWWSFVVAILAIVMHQVFDIANKKQAYRLSEFNMTMYYLDHLYDSISCIQIVDMTAKLFQVDNATRIACIFFFAMLPFYTHHLSMYASGYLTFYTFSPAVQGLLILEILFIMCAIFPQLPTILVFGFKVSQVFIWLCALWLVIFLIDDIRTIANMKKDVHQSNLPSESVPIKNLFVIGVIGYIMMETTMVEQHLLKDSMLFTLCISALTLVFTILISELVLSYGFEEKHRQFTLKILLTLFWVVLYYSVCGLISMEQSVQIMMGQILFGVVFVGDLLYFFYYHYSNVKYLNGIIKEE